jgi:DNA-binding MarR family transcriptional regulator
MINLNNPISDCFFRKEIYYGNKKTIEESYKFWFGMNNVYEEWAKENDLTSNSLMILYLIENSNHEITQKMIGEKLYLPKQTVNSTLNNMEKKITRKKS